MIPPGGISRQTGDRLVAVVAIGIFFLAFVFGCFGPIYATDVVRK